MAVTGNSQVSEISTTTSAVHARALTYATRRRRDYEIGFPGIHSPVQDRFWYTYLDEKDWQKDAYDVDEKLEGTHAPGNIYHYDSHLNDTEYQGPDDGNSSANTHTWKDQRWVSAAHSPIYGDCEVLVSNDSGSQRLCHNRWYRLLYFWGLTWFIVFVGPLTVLAIVNMLLIRAIRRAMLQHAALTQSSPNDGKENLNVTINVVAIVSVFLLCQSLDFVVVVLQTWPPEWLESALLSNLSSAAQTMLALNAGINFFIYTMFYTKFRHRARRMFTCRFCVNNNTTRHDK